MRETTVAATIVLDTLRFLESRGHPSIEVCRDAGIDSRVLTRPDDRVPGSQMSRLWQVAIARTGDPLFSLHSTEEFNPAALDILGYVVLTCQSLGDVMNCLVRYACLLNDGLRVTLAHDGPRTVVQLDIVSSHLHNELQIESRHAVDSMWVGLAKQLRSVSAAPVIPLEVWFTHDVDDDTEYRRAFGAPLRFRAPHNRFVLASSDLARPIPSANAALFAVFEQHAEALLAGLDGRTTAAGQASRVIAERLRGRVPPIGEVASELAMSARNLQRALQAEGRTYQQVLDDIRCAMATRYLADRANSVSQVAFLLGFSESAAFHRAYKRWTGETPAMARRVKAGHSLEAAL